MPGYSGTPLPRKLGIKEGHRVALLSAPPGFTEDLGDLPGGVTVFRSLRGTRPLDVVLLFCKSRAELRKRFPPASRRIEDSGAVWACWPKRASGLRTDLSGNIVRSTLLQTGLVDVKVCAVDETWSGLKFVIRVKDRGPRTGR